jgi:hypothetical protein
MGSTSKGLVTILTNVCLISLGVLALYLANAVRKSKDSEEESPSSPLLLLLLILLLFVVVVSLPIQELAKSESVEPLLPIRTRSALTIAFLYCDANRSIFCAIRSFALLKITFAVSYLWLYIYPSE